MSRAIVRNSLGVALAAGLIIVGMSRAQVEAQSHAFEVVTVAEGLENPWSVAWLPNGDLLITERPGRLRVVREGVLLPEPVPGVPAVRARGQGGLLEIAVHPDYASNQLVYMTIAKPSIDAEQAEGTTALVRARFDGNQLTDVEEIFEARAWSTTGGHYGSRIVFDGEGHLFMTIGDRQAPPLMATVREHPAQDRSNHQGTILRLNLDGSVPADNPFVGQAGILPEIWSWGHRSPQGLAINPVTGDLWETEHGPMGGDELNLIRRGANYGWPVTGFGINYDGARIHLAEITDEMEEPRHFWVPSIATSGLMFYDGDQFPNWRGHAFVGGLAGEQLVRLPVDGDEVLGRVVVLDNLGRIRDIRQGPDGFVYLAVDSRQGDPTRVVRLEPAD
jgi:glucose/arabinose dehydrogenase